MWSRIISKTLLGLSLLTATLWGGDLVYTPKVFFDTTKPLQSVNRYDNQTGEFLRALSQRLGERLLEHLTQKGIVLMLKNGIGSDVTLFYTFPHAAVNKISLFREEGTRRYYRFGYRVDITLALYAFKTSENPQLVCYKTYRFLKYYPPQGEYLPHYLSLVEPIAESLYLKMAGDIDGIIERVEGELRYYKRLGEENATSRGGSRARP